MKKFILAIAAVATLSTAALAERNYDLRDSAEAQGSFSLNSGDAAQINTLPQIETASDTKLLFGKYGIAKDAAELRRWNEKNGG